VCVTSSRVTGCLDVPGQPEGKGSLAGPGRRREVDLGETEGGSADWLPQVRGPAAGCIKSCDIPEQLPACWSLKKG
jgi:hypothetical protein